MASKLKDPVSGLTHLLGAFLSIAGSGWLIYFAASGDKPWHVVSFAVFGASLVLLYTASALYHLLRVPERASKTMRRIDHMMIYLLIAGTYTPISLIALRGAWGWSLFGVIWGLAAAGIVLKLFWLDAPRWLYTLFYVFMGWLVVVAFVPLMRALPPGGIGWLVVGGVLYSVGALIYGLKRPDPFPKVFGFHEIFHLFVMAGSASHFWLMNRYILSLP